MKMNPSRPPLFAPLFVVFAAALLWTGSAMALPFSVKSPVSGKAQPSIVFRPQEGIKSLDCSLKRGDGKKIRLRANNIRGGSEKRLTIRQAAGTEFKYSAICKVKWKQSPASTLRFRFAAIRVAKLKLKLNTADVDLDARSLKFSINNPAKRATLTLMGEGRKVLHTVKKNLSGTAAGTSLQLSWPEMTKKVVTMELRVHDIAGFWKAVRLIPVQARIPAERIEFDTAKWNVRPSEEPKLKRILAHINKEMSKFKRAGVTLQFRVYVAGYTDTVGSPGANRTLSTNRARSLATWLRRNGLRAPLYYQGFGERVLAKATPDETPEQANRRSVFVLATQTPTGRDFPKGNWSNL